MTQVRNWTSALVGTLLLLIVSTPVGATKYPTSDMIAAISIPGGSCSAFSVHPAGTYFTAAHCLHGGAELDGRSVTILLIDDQTDLGVFKAKGRTAFLLGKAPKVGSVAYLAGYGAIPGVLIQWQGLVFATAVSPAEGIPPVLLIGTAVSPGMSGGPMINKDGKVISVISGGGDVTGTLRNLTGGVPYFAVEQAWRRYGPPEGYR